MADKKAKGPSKVEQLLAGGPPSLIQTISPRAPLGPPEGYYTGPTARLDPVTQGTFTPYYDGDEWEPRTTDPKERARLQALMNRAGLYGEANGNFPAGRWGREEATAYKQVLEEANAAGTADVDSVLQGLITSAETVGLKGKTPKQPLVSARTNPESIRQTLRKTSLLLTGMRLSDEEERRIIDGYTGLESAAAAQRQSVADSEVGGSYTEAPSVEEYATSQLENTPQAAAQRYLDAFEKIHASLTGNITEGARFTEGGGVSYG